MRHKEIIVFVVLIMAANIPLFWGGFFEDMSFMPDNVWQGQWWRIVTHPFVHVSFYHLLLDGAAFLLLYAQLAETRLAKRLVYLAGIHTAVMTAVTCSLSAVGAAGYCGLSGVAHGLMAIWCLERIVPSGQECQQADRMEQWIAVGIFTALTVKSIYEAAAGHVFLSAMHLGDVGVPVVISHLGGISGAVMTYALLNISQITAYVKNNGKRFLFSENLR